MSDTITTGNIITAGNIKGENTDVKGIDVTPKPEPPKPEPPKPDTSAYDSIIEQQSAQIEALIKQNENLTAQVTKMIETGAQIRDEGAGEAHNDQGSTGENFKRPEIEARDDKDDFTVDYLGKFIGGKHN